MARNYPLKRIRYWYAYDVDEICALYKDTKLHPQTVLGWIKAGLKTSDSARPFLIMGHELSTFLGNRNKAQTHSTQLHEIFCMGCQDIKIPYRKQVCFTKQGYLHNIKAVCPDCKKIINKGIKLEVYPVIKKFYAVVDVSQLYDCPATTDKTHLFAQLHTQPNEPLQGELFP